MMDEYYLPPYDDNQVGIFISVAFGRMTRWLHLIDLKNKKLITALEGEIYKDDEHAPGTLSITLPVSHVKYLHREIGKYLERIKSDG